MRRSHRIPDADGSSLREFPTRHGLPPKPPGRPDVRGPAPRARIAAAWCADPAHAESFPPMVFNITDGRATDFDEAGLRALADDQSLPHGTTATSADQHPHRRGPTPHGVFPRPKRASYPNRYAAVLDCSALPRSSGRRPRSQGPGALPPFRGMSFNASAEEADHHAQPSVPSA